jgi:hypothetical protein
MTRRTLLAGSLLVLASVVSFPVAARPAEKAGPLEVTYYYLPG